MEEIDVKEVFDYLKKYSLKMITAIIIFSAILIILNIFLKKPVYKSDTNLILINANNDKINTQDVTLNSKLIGTYSQIVKSRSVVEDVKNKLELKESIGNIVSKISVSKVENTDMIKITITDSNPEKAKTIANEIAKVFSKRIKELYNIDNIKVVDEAKEPSSPYNINYKKDAVLIIMLVTAGCFLVIFIKFYFDNTVKGAEEVEKKFDLTVLGEIPDEGGK